MYEELENTKGMTPEEKETRKSEGKEAGEATSVTPAESQSNPEPYPTETTTEVTIVSPGSENESPGSLDSEDNNTQSQKTNNLLSQVAALDGAGGVEAADIDLSEGELLKRLMEHSPDVNIVEAQNLIRAAKSSLHEANAHLEVGHSQHNSIKSSKGPDRFINQDKGEYKGPVPGKPLRPGHH